MKDSRLRQPFVKVLSESFARMITIMIKVGLEGILVKIVQTLESVPFPHDPAFVTPKLECTPHSGAYRMEVK